MKKDHRNFFVCLVDVFIDFIFFANFKSLQNLFVLDIKKKSKSNAREIEAKFSRNCS